MLYLYLCAVTSPVHRVSHAVPREVGGQLRKGGGHLHLGASHVDDAHGRHLPRRLEAGRMGGR